MAQEALRVHCLFSQGCTSSGSLLARSPSPAVAQSSSYHLAQRTFFPAQVSPEQVGRLGLGDGDCHSPARSCTGVLVMATTSPF